ncbi:MAG: hypothetical protein R3C11_15540 [Planctomycetaceae bacterium]
MFRRMLITTTVLLGVWALGLGIFKSIYHVDYTEETLRVSDLFSNGEQVQAIVTFSSARYHPVSKPLKKREELLYESGESWLVTWTTLDDFKTFDHPKIQRIGQYKFTGENGWRDNLTGINPRTIKAIGSEDQILLMGDKLQSLNLEDGDRVTIPGNDKTSSLSHDCRHLLSWEEGLKIYTIPEFQELEVLPDTEELTEFRESIASIQGAPLFVTDQLSHLVFRPHVSDTDLKEQSIANVYDIREDKSSIFKMQGRWRSDIKNCQLVDDELVWLVAFSYQDKLYLYDAQGILLQQIPILASKYESSEERWHNQKIYFLDGKQREFRLIRFEWFQQREEERPYTISGYRYNYDDQTSIEFEVVIPKDKLVIE